MIAELINDEYSHSIDIQIGKQIKIKKQDRQWKKITGGGQRQISLVEWGRGESY